MIVTSVIRFECLKKHKKATLDDSAFFALVSGQEPVYLLLGF